MASEDENLPVSIQPQEAWFVNHGLQREEGARTAIRGARRRSGPSVLPVDVCDTVARRPHRRLQSASREANDNVHIDADGLIRDNCERLRFRAEMPGYAVLQIQNIRTRRQRDAIVSVP